MSPWHDATGHRWHRHQHAQLRGPPEGIETEALEHGGWAGRSSEAARGAAAAVAWSWLVLLRYCRTCPDCHSGSAGTREGPGRSRARCDGSPAGGFAGRHGTARPSLLPSTVDSHRSALRVRAAVQSGGARRQTVCVNHRSHATESVRGGPGQGRHIRRKHHPRARQTRATRRYWLHSSSHRTPWRGAER